MHYILSEEEFKTLKGVSPKYDQLVDILYHIEAEHDKTAKLTLYSKLVVELVHCQQDGNEEATLFAWTNRKPGEI